MPGIRIKRGTRAQIDAAAAGGALAAGEPYLVTDEGRLAVGTASSAYADAALRGEGQTVPWVKRLSTPRIVGDVAIVALASQTLTAARQYYVPLCVPRPVVLSGLRISVTTAQAGQANLGIYDTATVSGSHVPGNLIAAIAATLDTGSTGDKTGSFAQALTLLPGRTYWAALIASAAPTVRALPAGAKDTALGRQVYNTGGITHLYANGSGSTLPTTAPAVFDSTGNTPAIYLIEV